MLVYYAAKLPILDTSRVTPYLPEIMAVHNYMLILPTHMTLVTLCGFMHYFRGWWSAEAALHKIASGALECFKVNIGSVEESLPSAYSIFWFVGAT